MRPRERDCKLLPDIDPSNAAAQASQYDIARQFVIRGSSYELLVQQAKIARARMIAALLRRVIASLKSALRMQLPKAPVGTEKTLAHALKKPAWHTKRAA